MDPKNLSDDKLVETGGAGGPRGAHIEMMRRLKNSIEKLEKSTSRYSQVLILLTLILMVVGLMQLVTSIFVSDLSSVDKLITELITLGLITFCLIYLTKRAEI